jgi:hypothetical protein
MEYIWNTIDRSDTFEFGQNDHYLLDDSIDTISIPNRDGNSVLALLQIMVLL